MLSRSLWFDGTVLASTDWWCIAYSDLGFSLKHNLYFGGPYFP